MVHVRDSNLPSDRKSRYLSANTALTRCLQLIRLNKYHFKELLCWCRRYLSVWKRDQIIHWNWSFVIRSVDCTDKVIYDAVPSCSHLYFVRFICFYIKLLKLLLKRRKYIGSRLYYRLKPGLRFLKMYNAQSEARLNITF